MTDHSDAAPDPNRGFTPEEVEADARAYWRVVDALWPYWEQQSSMPAEDAVTQLVAEHRRLREELGYFKTQAVVSREAETENGRLRALIREAHDDPHAELTVDWLSRASAALDENHEEDQL